MSFLNSDVDANICISCLYQHNPYMSNLGVYSPCLKCKAGSNYKINKRLKINKKKA